MRDQPRRTPLLAWVLGIALFVGVLAGVQAVVGWRALLAPWREIPPGKLGTAFLLVLGSYAVRTVRVYHYFGEATRGRFTACFRLTLFHNLFNNLLPMRTGEASFPLLMKRDFQVPFSRSVPGLLYLRFLDLHFLLLLGGAILLPARGWVGWALLLALAPVPLLAFRLQGWLPDRAAQGLPSSPPLFWGTWLWTALNWTAKLLVFAWTLQAFSSLPFPTALLGSITGELSSVLPVHGLAGAGTYEAGVLAGLLPTGSELEAALRGAVNLHLFVLGASLLSAALALLIPRPPRHTAPAPGREPAEGADGQERRP